MIRAWGFLLFFVPLMTSCGDSSGESTTAPTVSAPFTITDLRVGTGARAVAGTTLTANYTGWLYSEAAPENKGQQFDSARGFQFRLGAGQVIAGWDQGFTGMREGGLRRLVIPPTLAYGSSGAGGVIPPNATLVFDVELVAVN